MRRSDFLQTALALAFLLLNNGIVNAQDDPALAHAQRIFDLIREGKFSDAASEFNAQMASALDANRLAQGWAGIKMQAGEFKSVSDRKVAAVGTARVVTLTTKFERVTLDTIISFDAENKIAGLGFTNPRPPDTAEATPAPLPK